MDTEDSQKLKVQRNNANRKAKVYFRKWKRLVQERDKIPNSLQVLQLLEVWLNHRIQGCKDSLDDNDGGWGGYSETSEYQNLGRLDAYKNALSEIENLRRYEK